MNTETRTPDPEANRIIDALGGTCKVAELMEITTGGVSHWRFKGIPKPRIKYIQLLRPDLFKASKQ